MITPYDWQESIGARAQYIEAKLSQGSPVFGLSLKPGVLLFSFRRTSQKLFEIYDRLGFGALGQQSDVEAIRTGAVEFASREGYQRSEQDVTIQRVASSISQPIKRAFADFSTAPFVARCLFAEVNEKPEEDLFYKIDYTGDYEASKEIVVVAGDAEMETRLHKELAGLDRTSEPEALLEALEKMWHDAVHETVPDADETIESLKPEAVLIERSEAKEDRFRWILSTPI